MKKIMFNDRYGLTKAVLGGRKTQTRRITCNDLVTLNTGYKVMPEEIFYKDGVWHYRFKNGHTDPLIKSHLPKYKVGEVVAVAQSYADSGGLNGGVPLWETIAEAVGADSKGWDNKMFVRPDLMPHRIRITDMRIERLQDISNEDCLKEGIEKMITGCEYCQYSFYDKNKSLWHNCKTPREAFARLIDKVSGKGTWDSNPYVWVYDFELIR